MSGCGRGGACPLRAPPPLPSLHHHPGVFRQAGETILTNLVRLSNYALDLQMYVGYCVFFCLFKPNKI